MEAKMAGGAPDLEKTVTESSDCWGKPCLCLINIGEVPVIDQFSSLLLLALARFRHRDSWLFSSQHSDLSRRRYDGFLARREKLPDEAITNRK